jgi:Tol biopolymer transport system component
VVYSKTVSDRGVIYRRRINGTGLVQVTNDAFDNISPSWSKEGDKIFFSSSRTGGYCIWSMNVTGGSLAQLTFDGTLDLSPSANSGATHVAFQRISSNVGLRGLYKVQASDSTLTPLLLSPNVRGDIYWTGTNGRAPVSASAPWASPSPRIRELIERFGRK